MVFFVVLLFYSFLVLGKAASKRCFGRMVRKYLTAFVSLCCRGLAGSVAAKGKQCGLLGGAYSYLAATAYKPRIANPCRSWQPPVTPASSATMARQVSWRKFFTLPTVVAFVDVSRGTLMYINFN